MSDCESSQESTAGSDCDEDEQSQNLEPELSEIHDDYENALLHARIIWAIGKVDFRIKLVLGDILLAM